LRTFENQQVLGTSSIVSLGGVSLSTQPMMPAELIEERRDAFAYSGCTAGADRLPDPSSPYTLAMAATDHTIRLPGSTYARLQAEAARSHRAIDEIAGELLDERLPQPIADREQARSALECLAGLRARVGRGVNAVALVRESREELDQRIPSSE
jgi:hypothetical protein